MKIKDKEEEEGPNVTALNRNRSGSGCMLSPSMRRLRQPERDGSDYQRKGLFFILLTPLHAANMVQAAAHVLATLALDGHNLIAKNITGEARIQDAGAFVWSVPGEDERHVGMCGQDT